MRTYTNIPRERAKCKINCPLNRTPSTSITMSFFMPDDEGNEAMEIFWLLLCRTMGIFTMHFLK